MKRDTKWWVETASLAMKHPDLVIKRFNYNTQRAVFDLKAKMGFYKYPNNIIFLAGMAGSGSTWVKNLLARIPGYFTRPSPMPTDVIYRQDICDSAFSQTPANCYSLFKTHLNPKIENLECIKRNNVDKVLVTYRDLRDVAVCRYHRMIDFPKPLDAYDYVNYNEMGKEKSMEHSINTVNQHYIPWIEGWMKFAEQDPDRYHFLKFEDLKKDTKKEFEKILLFYGIELSDVKINKIIEASKGRGNVKKNISTSRLLPWGLSSNFRSGNTGNWKKEFTTDQIQRANELYRQTLNKMGYEIDQA